MIYNILYDYQKQIVDRLKQNNVAGLFTDTGTGKSYMSIALYQDKLFSGKVKKCLVICLKGKISEWVEDFKKFQPFDRIIELDGKKKSKQALMTGNWDVAIINFERTWRTKELLTYIDKDCMIIIDESHKINTPDTKQGKFISLLGQNTDYKLILTATPMGNGYIDLYNQFYFLGLLKMGYDTFKEKFCVFRIKFIPGLRPFQEIARYINVDILEKLLADYCVFYERKVDNDLIPSTIEVKVKLDKQYNKIARTRVYEDLAFDNVSNLRLCLKSLCSGSVIGKPLISDGTGANKVYQLNKNKIEWVKTFLETFNERVVIFYNYNHQVEQLYEEISKMKRPVARYNSKHKEKDLYLEKDNCVMLCQYKSGGTGIDWLKKGYVGIFYSLPDSYIEFYQAKGRLFRNGQTKKPLFYVLLSEGSKSVDLINYKALKNKQDFTDDVFKRVFS